jgi:hypothetical protein
VLYYAFPVLAPGIARRHRLVGRLKHYSPCCRQPGHTGGRDVAGTVPGRAAPISGPARRFGEQGAVRTMKSYSPQGPPPGPKLIRRGRAGGDCTGGRLRVRTEGRRERAVEQSDAKPCTIDQAATPATSRSVPAWARGNLSTPRRVRRRCAPWPPATPDRRRAAARAGTSPRSAPGGPPRSAPRPRPPRGTARWPPRRPHRPTGRSPGRRAR